MIRDLLWACVVCGARESLRVDSRPGAKGREVCSHCGAGYARGHAANIVVARQGGEPVEMHPREWAALLPPVELTGSATCALRVADVDRPIRAFGRYWGRYEQFGYPVHGTLNLTESHLAFEPLEGQKEVRFHWSLLDLTAIQLSSSSLQLKAKHHPVVSMKFDTSSPKLWEERLQQAVQAAHRQAGHGDVVEFQPRVVTA